MVNLFLAMVCSALVSVMMRLGTSGGQPRHPMLLVNYLVCAAVSLAFVAPGRGERGFGLALGMGLLGGVLYLGAFLLLQRNVRDNGVTLSSAFMKLGVIVPTVLGLTLFGEALTLPRLAAFALTLAAIVALAEPGRGKGEAKPNSSVDIQRDDVNAAQLDESISADVQRDDAGAAPTHPSAPSGGLTGARLASLLFLMLWGGLADGLSKFYDAYGNPALKGWFLCFIFSFAALLCAGVCLRERQRLTGRDVLFGVLLGVPNYFSSRFLLLSLAELPASAAYPAFSCGAIALSAAAGLICFGERPGRRQWAALALVLVALALINI